MFDLIFDVVVVALILEQQQERKTNLPLFCTLNHGKQKKLCKGNTGKEWKKGGEKIKFPSKLSYIIHKCERESGSLGFDE